MNSNPRKKQALAIAVVIAVGVALGALILMRDPGPAPVNGPGHGHVESAGHGHGHDHEPRPGKAEPGHPHGEHGEHGERGEHEEHGEPDDSRVAMSDAQLQGAGVGLAVAGPAKIRTTLKLAGEVKYNSDRTVQLVPRLSGLVASVAANAGDRVRKGQVLAVLSSQALADQRAALLTAQQRLALARTSHEREQSLWEQKISPEQDVLQAQAALQEAEISVRSAQQKLASLGAPQGRDLTRFELRSPIDGVVTEKHISVGAAVKEDAAVFTVSDLATVWVEAPVSARDLAAVARGKPAAVHATSFDAQTEGRVVYVSALLGEQNRAAWARIVVSNPKGLWRPGLPVTVEATAAEAEVSVAVAAEAIQGLGDERVAFVRDGTHFEARPVELGRGDGRHVEVLRGLKAGDTYAAKNSFVVKAELGKAGASHAH